MEKISRPKASLIHSTECKKESFLKDVVLWRMWPKKGHHFFHAQESGFFEEGKTYYDKSCQKKGCFNSLLINIRAIMEGHFKGKQKFAFIIRDDTLARYLVRKKMNKIKSYLLEIEKMFEYFVNLEKEHSDMLVLLTTSEPRPLELPTRGRQWRDFVRGKDRLIYRKSSVLSPVWALGAGAENYCGLYEEAEVLNRTLNNFTKKRLHFFGIPIM
ncbi:MAG: hypothetical protein OXB88_06890 [Bacteriovoracales bacterium]|nr:hypothetical protein [Bacteriovoracales bacterium]